MMKHKPETARARRKRHFANFTRWLRETREPKAEMQERMAVAYARWLADRDGIKLPTDYRAKARVECDYLEAEAAPDLTWSQRRRVRFVAWGFTETKRIPGKGRRRAQYIDTWTELARIEIPHWDHVPQMTEGPATAEVVPFPFPLAA